MTAPTQVADPDPAERKGQEVARMFDAVAPTYDLLNHLLSFNLDRLWRRAAVRELAPRDGAVVLDLCAGSGDVALLLARRSRARVIGADFSAAMLGVARGKARRAGVPLPLVRADAMALPFRSSSLDGITVAFGVRNFEDLKSGLGEMARVLKPGGRAVILEFSEPRGGLFGHLYLFYFRRVLPLVGRLVSGRPGAYAYLPATVAIFPEPEGVSRCLEQAGLTSTAARRLAAGAVMLYVAEARAPA